MEIFGSRGKEKTMQTKPSKTFIFLLAIASISCSLFSMPQTSISTPEATTITSPVPELIATTVLQRTEITCSTENEQARDRYNDAIALQEQGNLEEAEKMYREAIELDPQYCDAMDNLGQLLRRKGNIDEAISWYKKSIEINPENPVAHQNLALAYHFQGETDDAINEYQVLINIDPDNPEGYYGLGNIYLELNQPEEAISNFKKAEELYEKTSSPYLADAKFSLGLAYFTKEEYSIAKGYFEEVYPEMGDNPYVNYYLGLCFLAPEINNIESAREYLKKAQDLGIEIPPEILKQIE